MRHAPLSVTTAAVAHRVGVRLVVGPPALLAVLLAGCSPTMSAVSAGEPQPRTVVTLGDSVPAGSACACDPFPQLYAQAQHAADVNLAEPGSTATDVRTSVPGEHEALSTATEVVIMTGANDLANDFDPSASSADYSTVAAGVQSDVAASVAAIEAIHPVPVLILGYWNVVLDGKVGAAEYGEDGVRQASRATNAINQALQAAAAQSGATYVPTYPAFHGPDGTQDPTSLLTTDGDHPNATGHKAIAALLPPLPEHPLSAPTP